MPQPPKPEAPVVVIGAGPHGLAAVAHLRAARVPTCVFGESLEFWRETMRSGMWLRSSPRASSISDPAGEHSLARWRSENGREIGRILHIQDFLAYCEWFQTRIVPDLDSRRVANVERAGEAFTITLDDGERFLASRVVVAAGLGPFAYVPPVFRELPGSLASHTSASPDLERFQGRQVTVVGAGQSALESAALLSEAGAHVELLGRTQAIYWLSNWSDANTGTDAPAVPTTDDGSSESWRGRHGLYWRPAPTEVAGRLSSWVGAASDLLRWIPPTRSLRNRVDTDATCDSRTEPDSCRSRVVRRSFPRRPRRLPGCIG